MSDFDEYKQAYGDLYEKELLLESEAKQEAEEHLFSSPCSGNYVKP